MGVGLAALLVVLLRAQVVDQLGLRHQAARLPGEAGELAAQRPVLDGGAAVAGEATDIRDPEDLGPIGQRSLIVLAKGGLRYCRRQHANLALIGFVNASAKRFR